ncbi:MAG: LysR family transcriptional regulator, partial [Actinobacteria bacterium]
EHVYVALPIDHPLARRGGAISIAELASEEWIVGRDSTSMLDLVTAAGRRVGFEPRTDLHSMDFEVILAAVEAGLGVALVPPLALIGYTGEVAVRDMSDLDLNRSVWAAVRRGSGTNPGIAAVLSALRQASEDVPTRLSELARD